MTTMFHPLPSTPPSCVIQAAGVSSPPNTSGEGINMDGRIRGVGRCSCGSDFKPVMAEGVKEVSKA